MSAITYDMRRADWLAGDTWLSAPTFPAWSAIDLIIIHWPGGNGVPVSGDPNLVNQFVRNQQSYSVRSRGYNLGYSTSVDWLGRRIEIRGDINRNAANAPAALNARSVSIQVLTNLDGAMTDDQVAGVRDLVGQFRALAPRAQIIGHRDGPRYEAGATATQCPGDVIYARIERGDFDPTNPTPPAPAPDPDELTEEQVDEILAAIAQLQTTTDRIAANLNGLITNEANRYGDLFRRIDRNNNNLNGHMTNSRNRYEQYVRWHDEVMAAVGTPMATPMVAEIEPDTDVMPPADDVTVAEPDGQ